MGNKNTRPILISLIIALSLLIAALIVMPNERKDIASPSIAPSTSSSPSPTKSVVPTTVPEPRAKLAIVIDDVGYAQTELPLFLALDIPLTFAVLPGLKDSQTAVKSIREAGRAIILHQPLEPMGNENPGPGLIKSTMDQGQIESVFGDNLSELNISEGFNNHMGSKGTQSQVLMRSLLTIAKKKHLYFLDSRTTDKTVSKDIAIELGVPFLARDVFLDDIRTETAIAEQLDLAISIAKKKGHAIAIGHIYSNELAQVLEKKKKVLEQEGLDLVYLRDLLPKDGL